MQPTVVSAMAPPCESAALLCQSPVPVVDAEIGGGRSGADADRNHLETVIEMAVVLCFDRRPERRCAVKAKAATAAAKTASFRFIPKPSWPIRPCILLPRISEPLRPPSRAGKAAAQNLYTGAAKRR